MVKQSFLLDPNAQAYTDDEIVAKVNNAAAKVTRIGFTDLDKVDEGTTKKSMSSTEKTKLTGIEDNATADLTATEIQDLIINLSDGVRKIIITEPTTGEFKVISIQRDNTGKLKVSYDDQPV